MSLNDRMKKVLTRLSKHQKYGAQDVVITVKTGGSFVPSDGSVSGGTPTEYSVNGIDTRYNSFEIDGDTIQQDDVKLTIDTSMGIDPPVGATVTFNGRSYRIMKVQAINVQGSPVGYHLQLRN